MPQFNWTISCLTLTTISNDNLLGSFARLGSKALYLLDSLHSLDNLTKDDMFPVQPLGLGSAEEELGAVRVGTSVGHRENSCCKLFQV